MNRRSSSVKRFPGITPPPVTTSADWCNDRADPQCRYCVENERTAAAPLRSAWRRPDGVDRCVMASVPAVAASDRVRGPSLLGVGMVVWLASELMFFAGLFAAYFTLRGSNAVWPPEDVELATGRTAVATAVLIVSSFTMHLAVRASEHDDRTGSIRWLLVTAAPRLRVPHQPGAGVRGAGVLHLEPRVRFDRST